MDYNTLIVLVGLVSSGLLLGSFGALVSLRGENLTADVAGHGVVSGVVLSQGVTSGLVWGRGWRYRCSGCLALRAQR